MNESLLSDVARMGALVVAEELTEHGILPLDKLAHIFKAAITAYTVFSGRAAEVPAISAAPSPN